MNKAAILHIPASEMAYYENKDELHLQLQSAHNDLADVTVLVGELVGIIMIAGDMKAFLCRKLSQLDIMIIGKSH